MNFCDNFLSKQNLNKPESILLLIGFLRGDISTTSFDLELENYMKTQVKGLEQLSTIIRKNKRIEHAQLNEIFLIFNKSRISKGYFYYFFVPISEWPEDLLVEENSNCYAISREEFRKGVIKARGYAMLRYGNFRFAHKYLRDKDLIDIIKEYPEFHISQGELLKCYRNRHQKIIDIDRIAKDGTWLLGYLSAQDLKEDYKLLFALINRLEPGEFRSKRIQDELYKGFELDEIEDIRDLANSLSNKEIDTLRNKREKITKDIDKLRRNRKKVIDRALKNTDIYLTWDYMDVYVATSMRDKWEYDAVYDFIDQVFYNSELQKYKLRFFDPTQSFVIDRLNKGLIESLMLKRAKVTIYLVQEIDTLGKDSELAATLAQGKPVIAYIPKIRNAAIRQWAKQIKKRPLIYFYKRFLALQSDFLKINKTTSKLLLKHLKNEIADVESLFYNNLTQYIKSAHFICDAGAENKFKNDPSNRFMDMCIYMAIREAAYYDKRAEVLSRSHPLAIQVNLGTGVANGILVARTYEECVQLVKGLLTNSLSFDIYYNWKKREPNEAIPARFEDYLPRSSTMLKEKISSSPYRIVTGDERITNSFWNFYLGDERNL